MFASHSELPVSGGPEKRAYVRAMFTAIAPTYDRLNRIISLRLDLYWRRQALRRLDWERVPTGTYLDLCAGTLDFSAALARQPGFRGRIMGADFVQPMLELGRHKSDRVSPVTSDALALPFPDASFDGAVVGWGVRNLADLDAGLREAHRVLRPGSRFVVLEMSTPPRQPLRGLYLGYFEHVLPRIGQLVSKHRTAYNWLPESARSFPEPPELARRMEAAGFAEVGFHRFLGGVTAVHWGARSEK
ncbi:MAG TPA: ubiquinone/menaquinone biosynthesis methyltransferase [Gemmatimonadales bacterium]|nr:ubiquinone/menaquinone biosynthesis methyltransferase [Gemmatimonadales bacterium]